MMNGIASWTMKAKVRYLLDTLFEYNSLSAGHLSSVSHRISKAILEEFASILLN